MATAPRRLDEVHRRFSPTAAYIMLCALVVARFVAHAVWLPPFEGPDEPFHLSRALDASRTWISAASNDGAMRPEVIAAIRSRPCCPDLQRAFGCVAFGGGPVAAPRAIDLRKPYPNYEYHQPPLYYLAAGTFLNVLNGIGLGTAGEAPVTALLGLRLSSVALVAGVLALPLLRRRPIATPALTLPGLLLVPGAPEALARCSNDALLFAWAGLTTWFVGQRRMRWAAAILPLGLMIKLTALPIVVFVCARMWAEGRKGGAATALGCAAAPVVLLHGWSWSGAVDLMSVAQGVAGLSGVAVGLAHSTYALLKTWFWVGEWSVFRPPLWVLAGTVAVAGGWIAGLRPRSRAPNVAPYVAASLVAVLGTCWIFLGDRVAFGVWGGVPGWYLWGWVPLGVFALEELLDVMARVRAALLWLTAGLLLATNLEWLRLAWRLYR